MDKIFENIDWKLLASQKLTLVKLSGGSRLTTAEKDHIAGVINLIDGFQDEAELQGCPIV